MAELTVDGAVTLISADPQSLPDVVLTDHTLSGSDGLALRNVRTHLSGSLTLLGHASFRVTDGEIYLASTPQGKFLIAVNSTFQI